MEVSIIPTIDLSDADEAIVTKMKAACEKAGFFYVRNHSVKNKLVVELFAAMKDFFEDYPNEAKEILAAEKNPLWRGYLGIDNHFDTCGGDSEDSEKCDKQRQKLLVKEKKKEKKESFVIGAEGLGISPMHGNNNWPNEALFPLTRRVKNFKEAMNNYFEAMLNLSRRIAKLLALSLGLDSTFFTSRLKQPCAQMVLLRYPGCSKENMIDEGCGAHTDCGFLTILAQGAPGLEVLHNNGEWLNAPPKEGCFIVNLGDMLSFWSDGKYKSTRHRARQFCVEPRYSVPFFCNCDYNAKLTRFDDNSNVGTKVQTAGAYISSKLGLMHENVDLS